MQKLEELNFQPSATNSVGIEVEIQILDRETGDLAPGAVRILKECQKEKIDGATAELMQSMLEIKTGVCANIGEARDQLFPMARKVRNIATSLGYELALGGTHPFCRASGGAVYPAERYERILDRLVWITSQRLMFGLHVHVGVPSGDVAIGLVNALVQYLPHMLALSSNSPFWQGVDTGLASARTALYGLLPHAGVPLNFGKWKDFRNYVQVMVGAQAIQSCKDIYWDIRPRPELGTIEFRIFDVPPTISAALSLAALTRTLVVATQRRIIERPHLWRGDARRHWIAVENKWLAARYGMQATNIRTPTGKRRGLTHSITELVEKLMPVARESGDDRFLANLLPVEKIDIGADRQRRIYREFGNWKGLVDDMSKSFADDLERYAPTPKPTVLST